MSKSHNLQRRFSRMFAIFASFMAGILFGGGMVKVHWNLGDVGICIARCNVSSADPTNIDQEKSTASVAKNNNPKKECSCDWGQDEINAYCGEAKKQDPSWKAEAAAADVNITELKKKIRMEIEAEEALQNQVPPVPVTAASKYTSINTTTPSTVTSTITTTATASALSIETINRRKSQWCPLAKCDDTDLCRPCNRRFLILITTPRSASTTLTWMMDSLPDVRMAGENGNTLGFLKKMANNVARNAYFRQGTNRRTSWGHNYMPNQTLSCVSQHMIESINPPRLKKRKYIAFPDGANDAIVGFKTIRFFSESNTLEEEVDVTKFLLENFPCSRVIVNINSDVAGQVRSIETNFKTGKTYDQIKKNILDQNDKLKRVVARLGSKRAYLLDKSQWTKNITSLNQAVSWLGFNNACHFTEILEFNTEKGYGNGKMFLKETPQFQQCKLL